jgi:hypothetical protein
MQKSAAVHLVVPVMVQSVDPAWIARDAIQGGSGTVDAKLDDESEMNS